MLNKNIVSSRRLRKNVVWYQLFSFMAVYLFSYLSAMAYSGKSTSTFGLLYFACAIVIFAISQSILYLMSAKVYKDVFEKYHFRISKDLKLDERELKIRGEVLTRSYQIFYFTFMCVIFVIFTGTQFEILGDALSDLSAGLNAVSFGALAILLATLPAMLALNRNDVIEN